MTETTTEKIEAAIATTNLTYRDGMNDDPQPWDAPAADIEKNPGQIVLACYEGETVDLLRVAALAGLDRKTDDDGFYRFYDDGCWVGSINDSGLIIAH